MEVAEFTVKPVAAVPPNCTAVAPVNPVPVMVTEVPPATGPEAGATEVTVGAGIQVNWSAAPVALVPPGVVTRTSTVPVPAGAVAVMEVAEFTVKPVAGAAPKVTAVAAVKLVPVIVTEVPPAAGPEVGDIDVTAGWAIYVNWSAAPVALVPPDVVTVTSTVPLPAGDGAVMEVAEFTVKLKAAVPPKCTAVAPENPVPVTVTEVPPATGPEVGATEVTVGAGI
jgi:hypothetical protein